MYRLKFVYDYYDFIVFNEILNACIWVLCNFRNLNEDKRYGEHVCIYHICSKTLHLWYINYNIYNIIS